MSQRDFDLQRESDTKAMDLLKCDLYNMNYTEDRKVEGRRIMIEKAHDLKYCRSNQKIENPKRMLTEDCMYYGFDDISFNTANGKYDSRDYHF